jgi:hypothetical protein
MPRRNIFPTPGGGRCEGSSGLMIVGAVIREKVRTGILPKECPSRVWAGHGTGKICDACDQPTNEHDVEHEIEMPDGRIFFFHQPCFGLWDTRPDRGWSRSRSRVHRLRLAGDQGRDEFEIQFQRHGSNPRAGQVPRPHQVLRRVGNGAPRRLAERYLVAADAPPMDGGIHRPPPPSRRRTTSCMASAKLALSTFLSGRRPPRCRRP